MTTHSIIKIYHINAIYNNNEIYLPLNKKFHILSSINSFNIPIDEIIKIELYSGLFNKIDTILLDEIINFPIFSDKPEYSDINIKLTFRYNITFEIIKKIIMDLTINYLSHEEKNDIVLNNKYLQNKFIKHIKCIYDIFSVEINDKYKFQNGFIYEILNEDDIVIKITINDIQIHNKINEIKKINCLNNDNIYIEFIEYPIILYLIPYEI
jgi:hypothetical protein